MPAAVPPICDFGWKAVDFALPGVDGRTWSLADARGRAGLLVMFICNHCPFVRGIAPLIQRDVADLATLGIGSIAIMSNDTEAYPQDGFDNMRAFARENGFTFPYVLDAAQEIARLYNAVCTPDFFGFNAKLELQYRGRLDSSRTKIVPGARRDLYEAMRQVAETGTGPGEQVASMGCSIKWRIAA